MKFRFMGQRNAGIDEAIANTFENAPPSLPRRIYEFYLLLSVPWGFEKLELGIWCMFF